MALKTCTRPAGSVGAFAHIQILLSQDTVITSSSLNYLASPVNVTALADGSYSVQLQATADLTPTNTYYTVTEFAGATDSTYTIQVPNTAGPFVITTLITNPATASPTPAHVTTLIVDGTSGVAINAAGDIAARSVSVSSSSPYTNTAVAGGADYSAQVRMAGPDPWADVTHPSFAGGAKGDMQSDATASITATLTLLTITSSKFAAGDVGKTIYVGGAGAAGVALVTTIASFVDANNVNLTAAAVTTIGPTAVIDWFTDDTAAIAAALVAGAGGIVWIPKASKSYYGITSRPGTGAGDVPANTLVLGQDRNGSILRVPVGLNSASAGLFPRPGGAGVVFCEVGFDGNGANQTANTPQGFVSLQSRTTWVRCLTQNARGRGFDIAAGADDSLVMACEVLSCGQSNNANAAGIGWAANRIRIIGNRVVSTANRNSIHCYTASAATGGIIADNFVLSDQAGGQNGIALGTTNNQMLVIGNSTTCTQSVAFNPIDYGSCIDCSVIGNIAIGGQANIGTAAGGSRVSIIGNVCKTPTSAASSQGIGCQASQFVIQGNVIDGGGVTSLGGIRLNGAQHGVVADNVVRNCNGPGILLAATAAELYDVNIHGNHCYDDQATKTQTYGFSAPGSTLAMSSVYVHDNDFRGNLTAAVDNTVGLKGPFRNNLGDNPAGSQTYGLPAIGTQFQNPTPYDLTLYVVGGTVTNLGIGGLVAPTNATFTTATSGGTLTDLTTYFYRVTALNNKGETLGSTETSKATGNSGANTNTITVKWNEIQGAESYKVYGRSTGAELFMARVFGRQFVDDGSVTPSGALPGADTTGNTNTGLIAGTIVQPAGHAFKISGTVNPTVVAIAS